MQFVPRTQLSDSLSLHWEQKKRKRKESVYFSGLAVKVSYKFFGGGVVEKSININLII